MAMRVGTIVCRRGRDRVRDRDRDGVRDRDGGFALR
jgi:hypothetical protein